MWNFYDAGSGPEFVLIPFLGRWPAGFLPKPHWCRPRLSPRRKDQPPNTPYSLSGKSLKKLGGFTDEIPKPPHRLIERINLH